jgi:hypothetical protein
MKKELEIIKNLKQRVKELLPVNDLEIKFKIEKLIDNKLIPDLIMHISYKGINFDMVGEVKNRRAEIIHSA